MRRREPWSVLSRRGTGSDSRAHERPLVAVVGRGKGGRSGAGSPETREEVTALDQVGDSGGRTRVIAV